MSQLNTESPTYIKDTMTRISLALVMMAKAISSAQGLDVRIGRPLRLGRHRRKNGRILEYHEYRILGYE